MQQIDCVFQSALERTPSARTAYLNEACADDAALRREVELLLAADEQAETLTPAIELAAPLLAAHEPPSLAGQSISHYQIISLLGQGGMGAVWRARDTKLDRTVALKTLPAHAATDAESMRRFVSEAKAASALNHPHVATIYEIGEALTETGGLRFIAMEYVAGQTLAAKINGAPLALNEIIAIASQIADALDEAHGKGITHRDIKPANVMLNERGQVKVLDFGLAKIARPVSVDSQVSTLARTQPGVVMGTVPYMSPEQALGHEVDHRTDIFSLGVVLYEMATGRLPFAGATVSETLDRILHSQPDALARFNYDVPAELERIVRKCLEKERERRYQSARELLVDVKNLQRDSTSNQPSVAKPVINSPDSVARSPRRWLKYAVSAAVLLALLTGAMLWRGRRIAAPLKVTNYLPITTNGAVPDAPTQYVRMTVVTDGPRLYYSALTNGQMVLNQVSGTGGEPVTLPAPFQNALLLDISPSRTELLVADFSGANAQAPLWILPIPGGSPRRLAELQGHTATWSPDGKQIAFAKDFEIFLTDSNGNNSRKLLSLAGKAQWLRWSPDGARLRFTLIGAETNTSALWEVNADGTNPHPLLPGWNTPAAEAHGNWTPDGKHFVFQATRDQTTNLWALREEVGSVPVQLTFGPLNFRAPVPSADGRRLFAVGEKRRGELVRYDKRTEQWVSYLDGMSAHNLSFSQDGEWVSYLTYPDGNLWRSRVDGRDRLQLTFPPLRAFGGGRWSPDGKQLVLTAAFPGKFRKAYLISADGGTPRQLTPEERAEADIGWSPDGFTLAFQTGDATKRALHLFDLRTGQESLLAESMFSPRWSPDGRSLLALAFPSGQPVLFDLTTKQWTSLTDLAASYPQLSRDGKYLYFVNQLRSDAALLRLRLSDRKVERWADLTKLQIVPTDRGRWMGLAPDDSPLVLRDVGAKDIYALEWNTP
ncbi:MAG: serine/threonine-protein kinase [Acidobacteria bacterium]|nr:serine/threonine-protein kinase [Acidobacteriota bacterium]